MTRDEHKQITDQLFSMASPEQQADFSRLLTQITDGFAQTLTDNETLSTQNQLLTERNEALRAVNTDLFLKVGKPATDQGPRKPKAENEPPKMEFDSLFNEKGELK